MATIRKVADLAGVSTATVSHVINDTRAVSAPLTARVLHAMDQLDYHPDIIARSLRRRETLTLGLLVPSVEIPFFARVAIGVEAAANDAGYSVILCNMAGRCPAKSTTWTICWPAASTGCSASAWR